MTTPYFLLRKDPSEPGPPQSLSDSSNVARMSCTRATVKNIRNKLVTYRDLREGLKVSREEFDKSKKWEDAANAGLMAARWVKASCDAFISMTASALSVAVPENKSGGIVKGAYTATTAVAEAGSRAMNGMKVDKLALVRDIKDGVVDMAGDSAGAAAGVMNLHVNIGIDAVRGDNSSVLLQATAGQLSETAKLAGGYAKELELQGAESAANGLAAVVDIATAASKFSKELDEASDDFLKTKDEMSSRRRSLRRTLSSQLSRIEHRISELEYTLNACVVPVSEK